MASGISFPLEYSNFTCEPYSSSYASYLSRFDLLNVINENGEKVHYEELERDIRDAGRLSDANIFKTYLVFFNQNNIKELACVFCIRCSSMHFRNPSKVNFFSEIVPPVAEEEAVVEYLKTYSNKNCKFLFQDISCM